MSERWGLPMVAVSNLGKRYGRDDRAVLGGLSFDVRPTETLWVRGPSGSGKSTLLNVLGLLARPSEGHYWLGGEETVAAGHGRLVELRRSMVSMVFQRGNLFGHLNALENVLVGMPTRDSSAALKRLEWVGLDSMRDRLAGTMSGGEQQRLALARASARNAPVLLADEPTSSLDDANAEGVLALLDDARRAGCAVIVASHDARTRLVATAVLDLTPASGS